MSASKLKKENLFYLAPVESGKQKIQKLLFGFDNTYYWTLTRLDCSIDEQFKQATWYSFWRLRSFYCTANIYGRRIVFT